MIGVTAANLALAAVCFLTMDADMAGTPGLRSFLEDTIDTYEAVGGSDFGVGVLVTTAVPLFVGLWLVSRGRRSPSIDRGKP